MISARRRMFFFALMLTLRSGALHGQGFEFKGQASTWGFGTRVQHDWNENWGIRYIPQFNYSYAPDEQNLFNAELLFNSFYGTDFHSDDHALKFYRAILRYTSTQSETQLGLQKINFGPAQLLRPLMWFDKVDPRDPLKLTDGVYALRYKYSFMNNSILWLWSLYGNPDPTGYEPYKTAEKTPEFGGRIQMPVPAGELAVTVHTRKADANNIGRRENRYALDGRWDVGIGIWLESVTQQTIFAAPFYTWNRMSTIGGDYTIPTGNGIYVLAEHMVTTASNQFWQADNRKQISAFMATYPLGVLDNLAMQEYVNWQDRRVYHFLQIQRTYDNFIITAALFHYPENGVPLFSQSTSAPGSGYGLQLMLIYNH
jgi:hypothetical protein